MVVPGASVSPVVVPGASVSSLVFAGDTCYCLLRRDGSPNSGLLGTAGPPYTQWQWKDLGVRIGGPHMLRLPDGRFVAAVRLYDGGARTSLCWVDPEAGKITEHLKLPSGGDTSYAGLVFHDGLLWVSYYSSHEGKTSIYLANRGVKNLQPETVRNILIAWFLTLPVVMIMAGTLFLLFRSMF